MTCQLSLPYDGDAAEVPTLLEPVPTPPAVALDLVLDERMAGDLFVAAASLSALAWWLTLRPVVGESLGAVLWRAESARSAACLGSGPELARHICERAGVLPAGSGR